MNTIAKAKGLLVEPGKTWDGIAAEPMSLGGVFTSYVLPLAAIPSIGSAIGTKIMPPLAARFGATPDAEAGMKLAAFAPTGAWVGGLALIVPSLGGFLALIGALYTLYLFYDGAQRLFPVAQVKARMLGFSAVLASILLNMLIGLGVGILAS